MFFKIVLVVKFFLDVRDKYEIDGLFENLEFIVKFVRLYLGIIFYIIFFI